MKKVLSIIFVVMLFVIIGISLPIIYSKLSHTERIIYTLTYYDDGTPGSKSSIYIYNDKVEIYKKDFCSAVDCESQEPIKTVLNYSKDNMEKLKKFVANNFRLSDNSATIYEFSLNKYQKGVIHSLFLSEYFFEASVEEYKYKLEYSKTESLSYIVYFKKDQSILVKKLTFDDNYKIIKIDTYNLDFSKDSLEILFNYIKNETRYNDSNSLYKNSTLKKSELNIIKSIIENNESYLKNTTSDPSVLYTITYHGLNCETPNLILYSDNTYEYYYAYNISSRKSISKSGEYNYDIMQIIDIIDNTYEDDLIYYIEDSNGKKYSINNSNSKLQEFLKEIDVNLETCLVYQ